MPCSSRACRLENELIDGSLGTIFHFRWTLHFPVRHSRSSLPRGRSRNLILWRKLLQAICASRRHGNSFGFRRSEGFLIRHLGGCHGCDPNNQERRATHPRCEALHKCSSADRERVFMRASGRRCNRQTTKRLPGDRELRDSEWSQPSTNPTRPLTRPSPRRYAEKSFALA